MCLKGEGLPVVGVTGGERVTRKDIGGTGSQEWEKPSRRIIKI